MTHSLHSVRRLDWSGLCDPEEVVIIQSETRPGPGKLEVSWLGKDVKNEMSRKSRIGRSLAPMIAVHLSPTGLYFVPAALTSLVLLIVMTPGEWVGNHGRVTEWLRTTLETSARVEFGRTRGRRVW